MMISAILRVVMLPGLVVILPGAVVMFPAAVRVVMLPAKAVDAIAAISIDVQRIV